MEKAHTATARAENLPVSRKTSIEIANFIRGKEVEKVKKLLADVLKKKVAVPFKRATFDRGHKRGIGPGRYPEKATQEILKLLASAESNARNQGLNSSLVISSLMVNKGTTQWRHGRQSRRQAKKAHIELILTEKQTEKKEKPKTEKKQVNKK